MTVEMGMDTESWYSIFKPVPNHFTATAEDMEENNWTNRMFETYGEEEEFVRSQAKNNTVWTLVDADYGTCIINGYHYVNRIGYYITEEPYEPSLSYTIYDDNVDDTNEKSDSAPIGADITYRYKEEDDGTDKYGYVSFGQWVEDTPHDTYGVLDDSVFYYFENADEMKRAMNADDGDFDFIVTSYYYNYPMKDYCDCPVEKLYSASEVCDYCINVAFFDDPDYAELLGYVLVDGKWVLPQ